MTSLFGPKVRIGLNVLSAALTLQAVLFAATNGKPFPFISATFGALSIMLIALDVRKLNDRDPDDHDTPAQA